MSKNTRNLDAMGGVAPVPVSAHPSPSHLGPGPKPYEPTAHERVAVERLKNRQNSKPPAPQFTVAYEGDAVSIAPDHVEPVYVHALLSDMVATGDTPFSEGLLDQIANVARFGKKLTARELNYALATVSAIGPRDPIESLLATQMMAIHNATMVAARRLNHTETIAQQDSASNMLNKLARTFAAQIETLKRYRADGEQKVTVQHQHVHVSANQALVGISQGGGGAHEKSSQSHAPSETSQSGPALLGHEQTNPLPLPCAGGEGAPRVPDARGGGWSPKRKG